LAASSEEIVRESLTIIGNEEDLERWAGVAGGAMTTGGELDTGRGGGRIGGEGWLEDRWSVKGDAGEGQVRSRRGGGRKERRRR